MGIPIKNPKEIEKMRAAGRIVALTLVELEKHITIGITTKVLDELAEKFILSQDAKPNFKNYKGFPASSCISVNDTVIHGIPNDYALQNGDIVSIDLGAVKDGYHGDAARTFTVGTVSKEAIRLIDTTKECFFEGLNQARAGRRVGDISAAIQLHAEKYGYSVVRNYCGHGIGKRLHEDPSIPNHGSFGTGALLKAGYTLAIEPMINFGSHHTIVANDKWTVKTQDGHLSAHYENTVLITHGDPEILTTV